jgi:ketosteroid isomerase-like protein
MAIDKTLAFAVLPLFMMGCDAQKPVPEKVVSKLCESMEVAFDKGKMQEVANFYEDGACLLPVDWQSTCGRQAIDEYWTKMQDPIDWDLTVEAASYDINDIYKSAYYQSLEVKPPNWTEHGLELDAEDELLYHLGHSTLQRIWKGEERTSEVDFIVVWRKLPGSDWKILVDSYN